MEVYKITNLCTNKVYVGSTKRDSYVRFREHCTSSKSGPVYTDIIKYGVKNFKLEILEIVKDINYLHSRESYWINKYWNILGEDNMYNSQNGVTHMTKGRKVQFSESHKYNLSNRFKGVPKSESHRRNLSESHKGKIISES